MPFSVSPTQSSIQIPFVAFLNSLNLVSTAPQTSVPVFEGQANRVPEPKGGDFVVFTAIQRPRLRTNIDTYDDVAGTLLVEQGTMVVFQVDVHGPNSADNSQVISTMMRDLYGFDFFNDLTGGSVVPLHADDPKQIPFHNAENQIETRWVIDAHLQANQVVGPITQQFAASLDVTLVEVETLAP